MKIAIVGAGISGLVAAHQLHGEHDISLFEAGNAVGGHTRTVDVKQDSGRYVVDTGFIVFNEATYPNFVKLIRRLGVAYRPTSMSFSVRCERTGLEYGSASLDSIFAQRRNLLRPRFLRMLREILRFNREGKRLLEDGADDSDLGSVLEAGRYSDDFVSYYIVPLGAAIWSTNPSRMREFPALFFLRFLDNHGLLSVKDQPEWQVIDGGSQRYVEALIRPYRDRIRVRTPVRKVRREHDRVVISPAGGADESFDHVVLATHSDQALAVLEDPSDAERELLAAIPYQENDVVLHTGAALLPRSRRAWASWNYHVPVEPRERAVLTYHMNTLQRIDAPENFCVTLNRTDEIDPDRIITRQTMAHPVYLPGSFEAQQRHGEISGVRRTHYCGAYWANGFHEDGVKSALAACDWFGKGQLN